MPPKKKISRKKPASSSGARARPGQKKAAAAKSGSRDNERAYLDDDNDDVIIKECDNEDEQESFDEAQEPDTEEDEDGDYVSEVEEAKPREKRRPGKTAGKFTANGRVTGRKLVPWHRPRMMEKLILCIQYECQLKDIKLPWSDIVQRLNPGSSGESALQFLSKERDKLIAEGHFVPPMIGHQKKRLDPTVRGYVQAENHISPTDVRSLPWFEDHVHPKVSKTIPGVYHGSGTYKQNPKYKFGSSKSVHQIAKEGSLTGRRDRRPKEPRSPVARRRSGRIAQVPVRTTSPASTSSPILKHESHFSDEERPSPKKSKQAEGDDVSQGKSPSNSLVVKLKVLGRSDSVPAVPVVLATPVKRICTANAISSASVATPPATPADSTSASSVGANFDNIFGEPTAASSKVNSDIDAEAEDDPIEHSPVIHTPVKNYPASIAAWTMPTPSVSSPIDMGTALSFAPSAMGMGNGMGMAFGGMSYNPTIIPSNGLRLQELEMPKFEDGMQCAYTDTTQKGTFYEYLRQDSHHAQPPRVPPQFPYSLQQNPHASYRAHHNAAPRFRNPFAQQNLGPSSNFQQQTMPGYDIDYLTGDLNVDFDFGGQFDESFGGPSFEGGRFDEL